LALILKIVRKAESLISGEREEEEPQHEGTDAEERSDRCPELATGRRGRRRSGRFSLGRAPCPNYFVVVLEGEVEVTDDFAGEARGTMGVFRPGRFVGDLNMLTGQAVSL
jgi:hypothetical protein